MPVEKRQQQHSKHEHHRSTSLVAQKPRVTSAKGSKGRASTTVTKKDNKNISPIKKETDVPKPEKPKEDTEVQIVQDEKEKEMEQNTEQVADNENQNGESTPEESAENTLDADDKAEPVAETKNETEENKEPERFSIHTFNDNIMEYTELFDSDKFRNVGDDFPVDDLIAVVNSISGTINDFKEQTLNSQKQLEGLREKMKNVKETIHVSISKNAVAIHLDDEQTIEERELTEKLAQLNSEVARANAELAETLRLSAETESTAVKAQLAAEKAKEEAKNIQEEIELKAKVEAKRKIAEEKKMEEIKRKREEVERMAEEARKEKEAEWKRKEATGVEKAAVWEKWPTYEHKIDQNIHEVGIGCIIRGHPTKFDNSTVKCEAIDQLQSSLQYNSQEELVSCVISLKSTSENNTLEEPIYVAVPFSLPRSAGLSREPFIKAEINGQWAELHTKEVTFDNHKEYKFAQAELKCLTSFVCMTRFKRDYVTFGKKAAKVTSSFDHRITISVQKDTFQGKEHLLMQVQPVDINSVNELRQNEKQCKGLLNSSPIVQTEWESTDFLKPLTITVPCPPNPAKARKIAQMRKLKEEKMKNPQRALPPPPDEKEEKDKKRRQQQQQQQSEEIEEKKQAKWYMGEYANNDDDENDNLYLAARTSTGKWLVLPDVKVIQAKLDLLQFDLDHPLERFVILRTRTNIEEDIVPPIANALFGILLQRFAHVIVKQRNDDMNDTLVNVVPANKCNQTIKRLSEAGYDEGPEMSGPVRVNEGDVIELTFKGNIKNADDQQKLSFTYNSNVKSEMGFYTEEVDRYLQKNFNVYKGMIEVHRCYKVKPNRRLMKRQSSIAMIDEASQAPAIETKREFLCKIPINIPKFNMEQEAPVVKAPVTILNTNDAINEEFMRELADHMGNEWKDVASSLNVKQARVQAIVRDVQVRDLPDDDARFQMLIHWLKTQPKSANKVSALCMALEKNRRKDLSDFVFERNREREQRSQESY